MSSGVQAGAGQLVEGWGEQSAEASAEAGIGEVDGVRSQGWRVSIGTFSPAVIASSFFSPVALLPIVCARVFARLLAAVGRAIACARHNDPSLLIDQWVDEHALEEHLVEQFLQVRWGGLVEAVAVFEEVKSLGEVLADFGGIGLVGG